MSSRTEGFGPETVTAASGTGHNIAAVTDFSTPDDGCGGHPKHVE